MHFINPSHGAANFSFGRIIYWRVVVPLSAVPRHVRAECKSWYKYYDFNICVTFYYYLLDSTFQFSIETLTVEEGDSVSVCLTLTTDTTISGDDLEVGLQVVNTSSMLIIKSIYNIAILLIVGQE